MCLAQILHAINCKLWGKKANQKRKKKKEGKEEQKALLAAVGDT